AFAALRAAGEAPAEAGGPVFGAYRALRCLPRAPESLYHVSAMLPPVSRFLLNEIKRDDDALVAALAEGTTREGTGVHHFGNEKGQRGGFSLYVPETYDAARPHPLIVACHGGSGHGRGFLWSWLSDAR